MQHTMNIWCEGTASGTPLFRIATRNPYDNYKRIGNGQDVGSGTVYSEHIEKLEFSGHLTEILYLSEIHVRPLAVALKCLWVTLSAFLNSLNRLGYSQTLERYQPCCTEVDNSYCSAKHSRL